MTVPAAQNNAQTSRFDRFANYVKNNKEKVGFAVLGIGLVIAIAGAIFASGIIFATAPMWAKKTVLVITMSLAIACVTTGAALFGKKLTIHRI